MHILLPICGKFTRAQISHQIFFFRKWSFVQIYFRQKMSFDRKKNCAQGRFNEKSFDGKLFSRNGHLTEKSPEFFFFEKLSFSKNFHLTDCSYSIRIVHVIKFFVAARRRGRKNLFLYCHYYYSNRVENMIKVTDRNEWENLDEFYIFIWGTAPGGDEDIRAIKLYSGRMQIQK
jgi:hypothetical protein